MNNKTKLLTTLSALLLVSGACFIHPNEEASEVKEEIVDEISYVTPHTATLEKPDYRVIKRAGEAPTGGDEEDDDDIGQVDKVILTYVNDDNGCKDRAFYIWAGGVDGKEFSDAVDGGAYADAVQYAEDGSKMTFTIDFNDPRFAAYHVGDSLMYIIKYKMRSASDLNWGKQSEDVELKYIDFPPEEGVVRVYCTPSASGGISQFKTEEETKVDGVKLAKFTEWNKISCSLTSKARNVEWTLYGFDETYYKTKVRQRPAIKSNYKIMQGVNSHAHFDINLDYNAHINVVYCIVSRDIAKGSDLEKTVYVSFDQLYGTNRFEKLYNYSGDDLGMTYTPHYTTFKVWSPVAANMTLYLYNTDTTAAFAPEAEKDTWDDSYSAYHMNYTSHGVWELTVIGDLEGLYYNFNVDTWNGSTVTLDPYATACGANGIRGLVYDKAKTNPQYWDTLPTRWDKVDKLDIDTPQQLAIYEVHMADFTSDDSWGGTSKPGTYDAFVEEGTTYTQSGKTVSTGFDHLQELGVNAVQLLPVFDSDNDETNLEKYNWGYNPLNYNCVEGLYSSNPHDGLARIKEYKNMIYKLAASESRVRVIMDVVYNHVSSPTASSFNKLMPRYYFRYDDSGELYDGSGCHNEFKSEATMARKFIVDSVCMWAKEYKIKGFRFDLMGLIDSHTMYKVQKALYEIDPDIYIYGEGWTAAGFHGGIDYDREDVKDIPNGETRFPLQSEGCAACNGVGSQVYTSNYNDGTGMIELGGFNGTGRDKLKGDGGYSLDSGFMNTKYPNENARQTVQNLVLGKNGESSFIIGGNPKQTISYASCHDDYSLTDQLYITLGDSDGEAGNVYNIADAVIATEATVFASNSAAFMLGGEELLRTKDVGRADAEFRKTYPTTYKEFAGHYVSHNSYNSPIEVNAFNWANKIKANVYGQELDTYSKDLTGAIASLVNFHKTKTYYDLDHVSGESWAGWGNNESVARFNINNKYYIYLAGRGVGYIPTEGTEVFKYGSVIESDGNVTFNSAYSKGFAVMIREA